MKKKRIPHFKTDEDVEKFLEGDLSEYMIPENFVPVTFEFAPKSKVINLRVPEGLFNAIKSASKKRKMPYQKYIREVLEGSLKKSGTRR